MHSRLGAAHPVARESAGLRAGSAGSGRLTAADGVQERLVRGGAALILRQAITAGIGFTALLIIAPSLGPAGWGCYAAALGLATLATSLAQWGMPTWLFRQPPEELETARATATTIVSLGGAAVVIIGLPIAYGVLRGPLAPGLPAAAIMLVASAICMPGAIALQRLEQEWRFGPIAVVEIGCQILFLVGAVLATRWWPVPAAVGVAWAVQQVVMAMAWLLLARHRPAWTAAAQRLRPAGTYGLRYVTGLGVWQLRAVLPPILVGHTCGASNAGVLALAMRLVDSASMARGALWRVTSPAMSRVLEKRDDLLALESQLALAGAALVGLSLVALAVGVHVALPHLLDASWHGVETALPALAAASIAASIFAPNTAALNLRNHSLDVAGFNALNVALLTGAGILLLPWLGWTGWLVAEVIALTSLLMLVGRHKRRIGGMSVWRALLVGGICLLSISQVSVWWFAPAVLLLFLAITPFRRRLFQPTSHL